MKKLIALILVLNSFTIFAQDTPIVKIVLDGKPALLNTKTGETIYTNGNASVNFSTSENNSQIIDTHTVEKGDTLYSISKKYGVSMAHIKAVNMLKTNFLNVNQLIKIGYSNSAEVGQKTKWIVAKGDTLYSISKSTGVLVTDLISINNLEKNTIKIGQKLSLK